MLDTSTWMTDEASELPHGASSTRLRPGITKLRLAPWQEYHDTGIIPIRGGAANMDFYTPRFTFASDAALWRLKVYAYGADGLPLDGSVDDYVHLDIGGAWNVAGCWTFASNQSQARIMTHHPDVHAMRFVLFAGNAVGAFGYAELVAHIDPPYAEQNVYRARQQMRRPLWSETTPTASVLYKGQLVGSSNGVRSLIERVDTTLSAGASSADTTIDVSSAAGMAVGDVLGVLLDNEETQWTSISGIASTTITLGDALTGDAASGNAVVTQRWLEPGTFPSGIGLHGAAVAAQGSAIADVAGGATVDTEVRAALNTLLAYLRTRGDIAT